MRWFRLVSAAIILWLAVLLSAGIVVAGESADALIAAGLPLECSPFGAKVSASEGNFNTISDRGYFGAFQFGAATLAEYYNNSADRFLMDPAGQVAAWSHFQRDQWRLVVRNHLDRLIGQQVCYKSVANKPRCAIIHRSAIVMACQFGCGAFGKLANYSRHQNCDAPEAKDGNGTSVCDYLLRGAGYDVSCFAGGSC